MVLTQQAIELLIRRLPPLAFKRRYQEVDGAFRQAYVFLGASACFTHMVVVTLVVSNIMFPALFSPVAIEAVSVSRVFLPMPFYSGRQVDMVTGVLYFLQYDYYLGCLAALLWAATLHTQSAILQTGDVSRQLSWVKLSAILALGGPGCAVAALMWDRDELVERVQDNRLSKVDVIVQQHRMSNGRKAHGELEGCMEAKKKYAEADTSVLDLRAKLHILLNDVCRRYITNKFRIQLVLGNLIGELGCENGAEQAKDRLSKSTTAIFRHCDTHTTEAILHLLLDEILAGQDIKTIAPKLAARIT